MTDYNSQKHLEHEERQDGCHSSVVVLRLGQGNATEILQVFETSCETLRLNNAGYVNVHHSLLYGRGNLAG